MDQGLLKTPNRRAFLRFTSRGLWLPTGSIHGFDLGNILMINAAYGMKTNTSTYAYQGGLIEFKEPIGVAPEWTIKGNQHHSRVRPLLLLGTKQSDVTIAANAGSPQTITSAIPGGSYDLGVRGLTAFTSLTNAGATVTYVKDVDYEIDMITGMLRIIETGQITVATTVIATYTSGALTREHYTAFDNQNQQGQLKCFGLRSGDTVVNEEWVYSGSLWADSPGDIDPSKDRDWSLKLSSNGSPDVYALKT